MTRGALFVISGPSGAGKGSIVNALLSEDPRLWVSVSATTRKPREGEIEGVSYFFVSVPQFEKMIDERGLLEWARVHDNYYGTPKDSVLEKIEEGMDVILEIDPQGAMQVKDQMDEAVLIFISAPSIDELRRRLSARSTETSEQIAIRCANAEEEMQSAENYDFVVLNDDLSQATAEVLDIIHNHSS